MNFSESISQALDSLKSNKLRSVLTMLGIVMGVFSIVAIMAIGSATKSYVNSQFERIGANTISITYKDADAQRNYPLFMEDMDTIRKIAPEIKNIATVLQRYAYLRIGTESRDTVVSGVSSQYKSFDLIDMVSGRFINDFDVSSRSKVIVVDEFFARRYFNRTDVVGEFINFKTSWGRMEKLKIIGVRSSGDDLFESMMNNENMPTYTYMPISTLQSIYFNDKTLEIISVSLVEKEKLREVGERIVKVLEMKKGKTGIYMAQNSADIQKAVSDVLGVVSAVLLVIAVITLIVGGIGIVNILLVSVTERIREIGIRKALGAQKKDIVFQFLTESIIMTGISGLVGILIGAAVGGIISSIIKIPPTVDFKVIILAFTGSMILGLVFGVYPAKKAADLDPIECLRYE
ncbi:MAG: ABC transporter permease [Acetivibrionales bacterium]|jgi:putative ABC transport system permease protein